MLSVLVSAAIAVPSYDYSSSYDVQPVIAKSYAEPAIIRHSAPVLTRAYAEPVQTYAAPVAYNGYEGAGYGKNYNTGFSTHYSIRHDVPSKTYAQPIYSKAYGGRGLSYGAPTVSYGAPVQSYGVPALYNAPIAYAKSYESPVLTKSYAAPIAEPIAVNYGKHY